MVVDGRFSSEGNLSNFDVFHYRANGFFCSFDFFAFESELFISSFSQFLKAVRVVGSFYDKEIEYFNVSSFSENDAQVSNGIPFWEKKMSLCSWFLPVCVQLESHYYFYVKYCVLLKETEV